MVLKDVTVSYGSCPICGTCSYINGYYPSAVYNMPALKLLISKKCADCGHKITIKSVKAKASIKDLK